MARAAAAVGVVLAGAAGLLLSRKGERIRREVGTLFSTPTRSRPALALGGRVDAGQLARAFPLVASVLERHARGAAAGAREALALFVFTRHIGCPCAAATMAEAFPFADERRDLQVFLVSPGSADATQQLADMATKTTAVTRDNVHLLGDASYALYDAFGVPVTGLDHMLAPEVRAPRLRPAPPCDRPRRVASAPH